MKQIFNKGINGSKNKGRLDNLLETIDEIVKHTKVTREGAIMAYKISVKYDTFVGFVLSPSDSITSVHVFSDFDYVEDTESQCRNILKHLQSGKSITALEALNRFGCFRLSARIYDLKKRGYQIESEFVKINNKNVKSYVAKN